DYRASRWGRWRPSALARAAGPAAVRLEQLTVRDGRPLADALAVVAREMGDVDRTRLEALAARFPLRVRRQYVGEDILDIVADVRAALEAEGLDASTVRTRLTAIEPGEGRREAAPPVRLYERNTP